MIDVEVQASGPIFTLAADHEAERYTQAAVEQVAREGQNLLVGRMALTFRHPTPYYWTQVWYHPMQPTVYRVDDARSGSPMVYGPWLEGTSSRNQRSRFKGYRIWRTVRQRLAQQAKTIAEAVLPPFLARMGGG